MFLLKTKVMKKVFHKIFKDKHIESEKDDLLKGLIDQHQYLLIKLSKLSSLILKRKIAYFIKYKKIFLLKYTIIIFVFLSVLCVFSKFIFKLNLPTQTVRKEKELILFVPDTVDTITYRMQLKHLKIKFIPIFIESPTKSFDEFTFKLGKLESNNNYSCCVSGSKYLGKYQFGPSALAAIDFDKLNISKDEFLNSPNLQEAALLRLLRKNKLDLQQYINKYNNKLVGVYSITESGLLAMAHNVGANEVKKFLDSGCTYIPHDGNGPATRFLIALGGYNLNIK